MREERSESNKDFLFLILGFLIRERKTTDKKVGYGGGGERGGGGEGEGL